MSTTLTNFLNTVPQPLTSVIVHLSEPIRSLRFILEAASWTTGSYYDSWLLLAAWWVVCLVTRDIILYCLPAVMLVCARLFKRWNRPSNNVTTENALQSAITDLVIIESLFPKLHVPPTHPRPYLILYLPYLFLTYHTPLRLLVAVTGSLFLVQSAPWAKTIYTTLLRSAHVRFAFYHVLTFIFGSPVSPSLASHTRVRSASTLNTSSSPASLRFLFTVYENQRWWMGLDWTAALIPAERPSWSAASLQPVSPPSSFSLPDDTTVTLPNPSVNRRTGKPGGFIRRTARWRWEEAEWRVVLRREGTETQLGGISRVERPLPIVKEEIHGASPSSSASMSRFAKLRESITNSSASNASVSLTEIKDGKEEGGREPGEEEEDATHDANEPYTDADGWVYGDNKWEALSNKGGLGKYTRYRRWTRIAIVEETLEYLDEGDPVLQKMPSFSLGDTKARSSSHTPSTGSRESSSETPHIGGASSTLVEPASAVATGTFIPGDVDTKKLDTGNFGRRASGSSSIGRSSAREESTPLQQRLKALASRDR